MQHENPFLRPVNQPVDFQSVTAESVKQAVSETLTEADRQAAEFLKTEGLSFDTVLTPLDTLYRTVFRVFNPVYLLAETHPEASVRDACRSAIETFSDYLNNLAIREDIYRVVRSYSGTADAEALTGYRKRYLDETVLGYKRAGFELDSRDREKLKNIRNDLDKLCLAFQKNTAESTGFIDLDPEDCDGLPQDFIGSRLADGKIRVDLTGPSYFPFMKYSQNDAARKDLWLKYNNRAFPDNLSLLDEILLKRQELAALLGYPTYADYALEDRMAGSPEAVWKFEDDLAETVREKARADYRALQEMKSELTGVPAQTVSEWEAAWLSNQIRERKYSVNDQEVKQYFELNQVLDGIFQICRKSLGLVFTESAEKSVWQEEVRQFTVSDLKTGREVGLFYLDLFPRENKYSHAAMFPLVGGGATEAGYERPAAALVCNFPKPTESQPSLLLFSDVNTLFHEFGHLLHGMVTRSPLQAFAGTNVLMDFVETPSQFFENFLFDYPTLTLFARHWQTGDVFPESLFNRIVLARNLGSGMATQGQIFYGTFDFTLHNRFQPGGSQTTTDILRELKPRVTLFPYTEGSHFHASFGHLCGYAAGYYSYLWAKVYAQDIWSVFEKAGALDEATGRRFREVILEPGGTEDPLNLVKKFLGRDPNPEAFLRDLGV